MQLRGKNDGRAEEEWRKNQKEIAQRTTGEKNLPKRSGGVRSWLSGGGARATVR